MFRPIYEPRTRAREYCDLAVNIYAGCPHRCSYCYAAAMAKRFGKPWDGKAVVRPGLLEALNRQLPQKEWWNAGRLIHLCFTCDPYPSFSDSTATRDVIKAIKESGNHVQILTKGGADARRDFFMQTDWTRVRKVIFARDGGICMKCGQRVTEKAFHVDHIVPLAAGGDEWDLNNLELSCPRCNIVKGAKLDG